MEEVKLPDVDFSPHINLAITKDDCAADKLIEALRAIDRASKKCENWVYDARKIAVNPWGAEKFIDDYINNSTKSIPTFLFTNDYFILNYFALAADYGDAYKKGTGDIQYRFISYKDGNWQSASRLCELDYNPVMKEFDRLYDLEQSLIYMDKKDGGENA